MSHLRVLCSIVFVTTFITPIGVGSAQRQNVSEPLVSPSPVSRRAVPPRTAQAVPVAGVPFDPRQRLHSPKAFMQPNLLADSQTVTSLAASTNLSASAIFLEAPMFTSGGNNATSVAVADLNGDGKPDLLIANLCDTSSTCANGSVSVLLSNGDGTFQPAVSYASGGYSAYSVAVGDLNGDGKPDLVVANACGSSSNCTNGVIGVLFGNADGTFQPAVSYSADAH